MSDSPQPRLRLPHWGWFLLATVVLVVAFVGLSVWLPWHREQHVILSIESWRDAGERECRYDTETGGPEWLREIAGEDRIKGLKVFDRVVTVRLVDTASVESGGGYF